MNDNPYASPTQASVPTDGRGKLLPVAISLMVVSILWVFMSLFGVVYFLSVMSDPHADPDLRRTYATFMAYQGISIAYCLLLISGTLSMVRRSSYFWAVTTSCLALVPLLGPCYFLGVPIGIWALVVLRRPEVRAMFQDV